MWLIRQVLFILPLLIYAGFRIRRLIRRPLYKNLSTLLFVLLVAAFPLADSLAHNAPNASGRWLMQVGYYSPPILLYFVLIVVLSDLVLGMLRLLKVLSKETVQRLGFRKSRLAVYVIAPALIVAWGVINYETIRIHDYAVDVPRRASEITGLKIAFASDFHLGPQTGPRFMERFVDKVNALNADLVLIVGDVLEGDRRDEVLSAFEAQFRRLKSKYGVFGVPGNHERFGGGANDFFEKSGIPLLQDSVQKIGAAFYLAGRTEGRGRNRKSAEDLLRDTPDDLPLILMDHRPTDLESVSRTRTDIQVSGHTHHGQLFPINWITNRTYELSWGHLLKGRTHFFVTSGIQLWGPRVRTVGYSEIVVISVAFRD